MAATATDYDFIQRMFLLESFQLYGIIGTAVVLTTPALWILQKRGTTLLGAPLEIVRKPKNRGNIAGGLLFGVGWSITGMCPGPILVNIGEGKLYAFAALAGVLVGVSAFAKAYPKLVRPLGLPELEPYAGRLPSLSARERAGLALAALVSAALGLWPRPLLDLTDTAAVDYAEPANAPGPLQVSQSPHFGRRG